MKLPAVGSIFSCKYTTSILEDATINNKKKSSGNQKKKSRSDGPTSSSDGSTSSSLRSRSRSTPTPTSVLHPSSSSSTSTPISISKRFDQGKITCHELETVFRRLGPHPPTETELALVLSEMNRDGDGCINLKDLVGALKLGPSLAADSSDEEGAELMEAFAVFDADGDGRISAEELLGVFTTMGDDDCTINDCRRMIAGVDSDGDGFVCYKDFVRMMEAAHR